jgi:hypothetical protein
VLLLDVITNWAVGWDIRHNEKQRYIYGYEGPRAAPVVLLVKAGWRGGKSFGRDSGRDKSGARRGVEEGPQLKPRIQTLNHRRAAYGCYL